MRAVAALVHELVKLGAILGKAQPLEKFPELDLLLLEPLQCLGAIVIKRAVTARRRGAPPIAAAAARLVHLATHAIHLLLHALHFRLPTAHVVVPTAVLMMPASHSSAPKSSAEDRKGQYGEAERPKDHEAEDRERDPGRFSKFIELVDEDH